jgi:hypothetical protein
MPIPAKACEGRFSDEVLELLNRNRDRDQWANHPCEICGVAVGAKQDKGRWVPEQHWPSVKYTPRRVAAKKRDVAADNVVPDETAAVFEESLSR